MFPRITARWSSGSAEGRLLADRPFLLLLIGRFLAMVGSIVAPMALAFGVLEELRATATQLSVVMASETVPLVAFVLVGGVIADRLPRNRLIVAGLLLSAVSFGGIGVLLALLHASWITVAATAVLSGVGIAIMNPALAALVPELVDRDDLHAANGLVGIVRNTARIAGLLVGGLLVAAVGGGVTLLGCAGSFGAAAILFAFVPVRHRIAPTERSSFWTDLRDGWRAFTEREWLWVVVLQSSLHFALHGAALSVIGPALAVGELGGAGPWSLLLACESAGTLAGAVAALRFRPRRTILAGVVAIAVTMPTPFLLLGLGVPLPLVAVTIAGTGFGMSLLAVVWSTTVQSLIDPRTLSRVNSYDSLGSMLMSPLGLVLAGPAVAALGARTAMLGCGLLLIGVTTISLLSRDVRTVTPDVRLGHGGPPR